MQAPKTASKGRATTPAAPAIKKSRKKTHEAGAEFYESYDLNGEAVSVGDDGELHACMHGRMVAWCRHHVGLQGSCA